MNWIKSKSKYIAGAGASVATGAVANAADYADVAAALTDVSSKVTTAQGLFLTGLTIGVGVFAARMCIRMVKKGLGVS
ncbi:MAG: hypothetical protein HZA93_15005 [Verrucomicrobia bacterium]|nr:hypothetical protein [Verrucomicrobiota bacterium]